MIELFVLNGDLERIGIVDSYTSLIWANRYNDDGDCELYVEANTNTLNLLRKGYYLVRDDDDMVCRIKKIELTTDIENGNYLTITGYDVKDVLGQRIIWSQMNVDGNVEDYIRELIMNSLVNPTLSARQIRNDSGKANFFLGDKQNFTEVISEQVTYKSLREKIQELCKKYGWGYKVITDIGNFYFLLYKGTDRSDSVIFSPQFENLISTKYEEDSSNLANVALVGGEGEGSERARNVSGYAEGLNRNEIFVDAKDISRTITWGDLVEMYPTTDQGGKGHIDESALGAAVYRMDAIDIAIVDDNQLTELQVNYPNGQIITKGGNQYYQVYDVVIADLPSKALTESMNDNDDIILRDLVYSVYLLNRGYEKLAEYGTLTSFEGTVAPNITFVYKQDYFLGDIVTVENEFGISTEARIVEVVEVSDENGYSVEPKFEYLEAENQTPTITSGYLLTENGANIITEDGEHLMREESIIPKVQTQSIQNDAVGENVKISQLPEVQAIQDGCCVPMVSSGTTGKVTYAKLKEKLGTDLPRGEDGKTPQLIINNSGHLIAIYED